MILHCIVVCALKVLVCHCLDIDHHGNFFMLAFMETYSNHSKNQIIITTQHDVDIEIKIPFLNQTLQYHLPAVSSQHVNLDYSTSVTSNQTAETKGISVLSSSPVSVYGLSLENESSDGYLAIPVKALSNKYLVFSYFERDGVVGQIGLIGIENQTTVFVSFTSESKCNSIVYANKLIVTYRINEYQVLRITCETDITGILVYSDKPIAVLTGHVCVPVSGITCDHAVEMAIPTNSYGTSYVLMPTMSSGIFRIIYDTSLITPTLSFSSEQMSTFTARGFTDIMLSDPVCLNSTQPVMVIEVMRSASDNSPIVDPFISTVPPTDMFTSSYTLNASVVSNGNQFQSYISIIASVNIMQRLDFVVDYISIENCSFGAARSPAQSGLINLNYPSDSPFGMMAHGVLNGEFYGFPAGMKFEDFTGIDECESNTTCLNDGICVEIGSSYRCYCKPSYTGDRCEIVLFPIDTTTQPPIVTTQSVEPDTSGIPGDNVSVPQLTTKREIDSTSDAIISTGRTVPMETPFPHVHTPPTTSLPFNIHPTLPPLVNICACLSVYANKGIADIFHETKMLQKKLAVKTNILSATVRKKISVPDERRTASGIGYIGVVVLVLVFGSIVASDLFTYARSKYKEKQIVI
ncbi:uncharacterized protein LOC126830807 [Patella vulgata]|uniref:uncharacterized protein LOC126830807 n=1 Tax=Patella vulgata TaxID=6465 RepID=UPI0021800F3F|nr:uncharacterized protein LOC126830807 [Patella vulgata]